MSALTRLALIAATLGVSMPMPGDSSGPRVRRNGVEDIDEDAIAAAQAKRERKAAKRLALRVRVRQP